MKRYKYIKDGDLKFVFYTKTSELFKLDGGQVTECNFGIVQLSKFCPYAEEYAESDDLVIKEDPKQV